MDTGKPKGSGLSRWDARNSAMEQHMEEALTIEDLRRELAAARKQSAAAVDRSVAAAVKALTAKLDAATQRVADAAAEAAGEAAAAAGQRAQPQPAVQAVQQQQQPQGQALRGGLPGGLQQCRRNAYLSGWGDGEYAGAAGALREFRSTLVRKGHGAHWQVGGHERFGVNPAVQPCGAPMLRLGEGDGGKWTCNLAALQPGCVIYSVGSDYNVDFELDLLRTTPCEVFTFDCTVKPDDPRYVVYHSLPQRLHFHRYCLGEAGPSTSAEMRPRFRTLASITAELGHTSIALLKMDIEGSEYEVVEDFTRGFLAAQATEGGAPAVLPDQVLFEQHFKTHTDLKWANHDDGLHAGEMALLWVQLAEMGYVPVSREDNQYCQHCSEFAVARAFC